MRLRNDSPSFHPVHPLIRAFGPRDLHYAKGRGPLTGSDQDRIALASLPSALWNTGAISPASATLASAVTKAFADKDGLNAGNQALNAGEAVLFAYNSTPGNSRTRQWFVAVNDSTASFSSTDDLLINVTGLSSSFATGSLIPSLLFATL